MKQISFVIILFIILSIKSSLYLFWITLFLWIVSLKNCIKLTKKVIKSIFLFNFGVTLGYLLINLQNVDYIIYINLKVFSMTYFLFWFFEKNSIMEFFSFSKNLSYLLTITLSQIYSYKKSFEDLKLAYQLKVIKKIKERDKNFIIKSFNFFLSKTLKESKERSLALKARGFFEN